MRVDGARRGVVESEGIRRPVRYLLRRLRFYVARRAGGVPDIYRSGSGAEGLAQGGQIVRAHGFLGEALSHVCVVADIHPRALPRTEEVFEPGSEGGVPAGAGRPPPSGFAESSRAVEGRGRGPLGVASSCGLALPRSEAFVGLRARLGDVAQSNQQAPAVNESA